MMFHKLLKHEMAVRYRRGFTLVEVLVALTMTLIILGAMAQAFSFASGQMQQGRASLEMTNRLRSTLNILRSDLQSLTIEVRPHHFDSAPPNGYFELIEGGKTDANGITPDDTATPTVNESTLYNLAVGDYDDFWAGTIKSESRPYRGRLTGAAGNTEMVESQLAEVAWFTVSSDASGSIIVLPNVIRPVDADRSTLYRRQLLVRPDLQDTVTTEFGTRQNAGALAIDFFTNNDISARVEPVVNTSPQQFEVILNTLEDLGRRHNRFAHVRPAGMLIPQTSVYSQAFAINFLASNQQDVMLTDLLAFDLKVFAPDASAVVNQTLTGAVRNINEIAFPGEYGSINFEELANDNANADTFLEETGTIASVDTVLSGSFVDLGSSGVLAGVLGDSSIIGAQAVGGLALPAYQEAVFETGTPWYNTVAFPQANNGIDDHTGSQTGVGLVDDLNEKVRPAYDTNIRGLEASIRIWERTSNQVRQATSRVSFVSE